MENEFWLNSPFEKDSIFHPSWEEKQKKRRFTEYEGVKITQLNVSPNYSLHGNNLLFTTIPLMKSNNTISSDDRHVTVAVTVTVHLSGKADKVEVALNKNSTITASRSISSEFQYVANFNIKVRKSLARVDQYSSQKFVFTATVIDIFTKEVSDTRSAKVVVDTDSNIKNIENNSVENQISGKCFCKKINFTNNDLKYIVTELRKRDVIIKNGKSIKDENGKKIGYGDFTVYNDKTSDGIQIKDRLFYLKRSERIKSNEANYTEFTKQLNSVMKNFEINSCLRKVFFLALVYQETQRFSATYESTSGTTYKGGDFFQGRGLIQLTHDYNYLQYYDYVKKSKLFDSYNKNVKRSTKGYIIESVEEYCIRKGENNEEGLTPSFFQEFKKFVPKLATNIKYAAESAGWYWKYKNLNKYADLDDLAKIAAAINHPALLKKPKIETSQINGFLNSISKCNFLRMDSIFDYENCH